MLDESVWLFAIFLIMLLGAVIAFSYFVIKPMQTGWAVRTARKIAKSGKIENRWQFTNVHRMLATARNDLDAAYLWQKLQEIREAEEKEE